MIPNRKQHHGKACPYCRRQMMLNSMNLEPTRDHVTPKCANGKEIIICCRQCNGIKGHMLPDQWSSYMAANPKWWLLSRAERRARARMAHRNDRRQRGVPNVHGNFVSMRQGSPPMAPVVVPPELIYSKNRIPAPKMTAAETSQWLRDRAEQAEDYSRLVAQESARRHPGWPDVRRFDL